MKSFRALTLSTSLLASILCGNFVRAEEPKADKVEATEKKPASVVPAEKDPRRHEQFLKDKEAQLKKGPIQVVFIGDSITDGWRGGGKAVWAKNYDKYNALNLGIGGDRTEHVLFRINHGELDGLEPKAVVMMIGTNNTRASAEDVIAGIKADVAAVHDKLPNAKILLLAVFPRSMKAADPIRAKITSINEAISKLDGTENVKYLDIGGKFLDPDGTLPKTIMPDALHPNQKGYEIWAEAIEPALDELVK